MPNRLASETSPYLQQHAHNPVDWYIWGEEALNRARQEDKPIMISIGYSACHWCHVMAHECFENREIADLLNKNFINIKVDREERPDLDSIYMAAVQAMTGSGGWPLTVFLTPDGKPFFGGTYFPPQDKHGIPGFPRVITAIAEFYKNRRDDVDHTAWQLTAALATKAATSDGAALITEDILKQAYSSIQQNFDMQNGGIGIAPKFPQTKTLEFLLRYHERFHDKNALEMFELALDKMAKGGIYDQIGGGFHRYSTDAYWLVPHFEKMLYDNAMLSQLYLNAYQVTCKPFYSSIAEGILDYILREMTDPSGGFYSSQDADSEGSEGKYFLWTPAEITDTLGAETGDIINKYFGVTSAGNFEGKNILFVSRDIKPEEKDIIEKAKPVLLEKRSQRKRPETDIKILASWNGLMLSSLSQAAVALSRKDYLAAAIANGKFLINSMMPDGNLQHTYQGHKAKIEGFLQDYAMVIEGLLALHEATLETRWLSEATRLAKAMVEQFWDDKGQTFYDTGKKHEDLYIRPRSIVDEAVPSGASTATTVLLKIHILTGNEQFKQVAEASLSSMAELINHQPLAFNNWLCALDSYLAKPQ